MGRSDKNRDADDGKRSAKTRGIHEATSEQLLNVIASPWRNGNSGRVKIVRARRSQLLQGNGQGGLGQENRGGARVLWAPAAQRIQKCHPRRRAKVFNKGL